ncbi:uncharacterized protein LOC133808206 [Humulus lupulus]|uniref:uncharacterized protein LOC133808206 n=1 Tax=Humulus lupulus TaxID=3486 RepID=UPI002B400D3E|nr:uncharacterized protein LOC133808206 [Humulus lupulus]
MPASRQFSRINTWELKSQIENKVGRSKAEVYFSLLKKYLSLKISKVEFHRLCIGTIGKDNLILHNQLIKAILKNASLSTTPPPKVSKEAGSFSVKAANGCQRSSLQSLCNGFPQSPRKGRTPSYRERKFRDRLSPLGPNGKSNNVTCEDLTAKTLEQQSATELFSLGSKPPCSVEDGEEVEQAAGSPGIHSRSPLTAPLGIPRNAKKTQKLLLKVSPSPASLDTCYNNCKLPDTNSLMKRLEQKLEAEGLKISEDCVNLMNNGLDVYLKRLIKPSLAKAGSRSENKHVNQGRSQAMPGMRFVEAPTRVYSVSMLDFRVAMEMNPSLLGEEWPTKLEKICLHESESNTGS